MSAIASLDILHVEDNPGDIRLLSLAFKSCDFHPIVRIAKNGIDALEMLKINPKPDLILLDLNLPRLGGMEVLKAIREDANLTDIPVIILSSSPFGDPNTATLKVSHAFRKPPDLSELKKIASAIKEFALSLKH
jgi:CheY-like chemotaxis protein